MKTILCTAAAVAMATAIATPASAQVSGIGVTDPAVVIAASKALNGAFSQIATTYAAQNTQLQQLNTQSEAIIKKFDTNNDGKLDQTEMQAAQAESNPNRKQLETLQTQINNTRRPLDMAAAYAVQQIAQQLNPAVEQVVTANRIQLLVPSSSVLYRAPAADVSQKIIDALDAKLPQVSISPPAGWEPSQETVQLLNDVQQARAALAQAAAARQQAAGAQAQKPAAATPKAPAAGKGR
jgi:Skp family chaperone for outer membrane proteins